MSLINPAIDLDADRHLGGEGDAIAALGRNSLISLVPEVGIEPTRGVNPTGF
jgi:hypothetical protein